MYHCRTIEQKEVEEESMLMIRDMNNTEKLYTRTMYKKSYTVRLIEEFVWAAWFRFVMDQSQQIDRERETEEKYTGYNYLGERGNDQMTGSFT